MRSLDCICSGNSKSSTLRAWTGGRRKVKVVPTLSFLVLVVVVVVIFVLVVVLILVLVLALVLVLILLVLVLVLILTFFSCRFDDCQLNELCDACW